MHFRSEGLDNMEIRQVCSGFSKCDLMGFCFLVAWFNYAENFVICSLLLIGTISVIKRGTGSETE